MNPETVILEERPDLLIIQDRNGVTTMPRSEYHVLRIKHYGGNRIFYDFGCRDAVIKETYDQGIFNCWLDKRHVQIADADGVARAITSGGIDAYQEMFTEWRSAKIQQDVIDSIVSQFPGRVSRNVCADDSPGKKEDGEQQHITRYEIDDLFCVDSHGVAQSRDGEHWRHLCIVAKTGSGSQYVKISSSDDDSTDGNGYSQPEEVKVNNMTMTVIAKMMFLLFPNGSDRVFMNQLSDQCKRHVLRRTEGEKVSGK